MQLNPKVPENKNSIVLARQQPKQKKIKSS
jgi:hypothetical protein